MNNIFDNIYIINLCKNNNKKHLSNLKLDALNTSYQLFNAVDGTSIQSNINLPNGAVGLLYTYINLLENAISSNYNNILIMEDDCCFIKNFNEKIINCKQYIDFDNYDVIYLGANQFIFNSSQKINILNNSPYNISFNGLARTFGTYAISFNIKFCIILFNFLTTTLLTEPIDVIIYNLITDNKNNIQARSIFPFLVMPDVSQSDIIGKRNQLDFCRPRKYIFENYDYLAISDYDTVVTFITKNNVSLRLLFWQTYINQSNKSIECLINVVNKNFNSDPCFVKSFYNCITFISLIYNTCDVNILLIKLFLLIEGSKRTFVCIVPSYNNILNYKINLKSFVSQDYPVYLSRLIYIDDCSIDNTYTTVSKFIERKSLNNRITLFKNHTRSYQSSSRYNAFHFTYDDEIVVLLDGDDWFFSTKVFNVLNEKYNNLNLLISYGSYYVFDLSTNNGIKNPHQNESPLHFSDETSEANLGRQNVSKILSGTRQFPKNVVINSDYRNYDWISCHLRTGYSKLFKKIKLDNLLSNTGNFYPVCTDRAEMIPLLEMAGNRHLNLNTGLYVYNKTNSMKYSCSYYNDCKTTNNARINIIKEINSRPKYKIYNPKKICLKDKTNNYDDLVSTLLVVETIDIDIISQKFNCMFTYGISCYENKILCKHKYFIYEKSKLKVSELSNLFTLLKQTKSLLATSVKLNPDTFTYLNFSNKYFACRQNNLNISCQPIPGIYSYKILLQNKLNSPIIGVV